MTGEQSLTQYYPKISTHETPFAQTEKANFFDWAADMSNENEDDLWTKLLGSVSRKRELNRTLIVFGLSVSSFFFLFFSQFFFLPGASVFFWSFHSCTQHTHFASH
jgi:hypothetical protein